MHDIPQLIAEKHHAIENNILDSFPVSVFPDTISKFIQEAHTKLNIPGDYVALGVMAALSLGVGKKYAFKTNYLTYCSIFGMNVGESGSGKSPGLDISLKPITESHWDYYKKWEAEYNAKQAELATKKNNKAEFNLREIEYAPFFIDDSNNVTLQTIMSRVPAVLVYKDEGGNLFADIDKDKGGQSISGFYNKAHDNKDCNITRISARPISIREPFLSIVGNLTYDGVKLMAKNGRDKDGFMYRFLFTCPKRMPRKAGQAMNDKIALEYRNAVNQLLDIHQEYDDTGRTISNILVCNKAAEKIMGRYQSIIDKEIDNCTEEERSIRTKLENYFKRFCLLLEMSYYTCGESGGAYISERAVHGAYQLYQYFLQTALQVNEFLNTTKAGIRQRKDSNSSYDYEAVLQALPAEFKRAEGAKVAIGVYMNSDRTWSRFLQAAITKGDLINPAYSTYKKTSV